MFPRRGVFLLCSGLVFGASLAAAPSGCGARSSLLVGVDETDGARSPDQHVDAPADGEGGPSVCEGSCSIGSAQCDEGGVSSCVPDTTGCGMWSAGVSCGQDQACVGLDGGASCRAVDIEPPRPIAPLSTSTVTSHQPRFQWVLAGQDDGGQVQICRDRACSKPVASFSVEGTSGAPAASLDPGLYYWRVSGTEGALTGDGFGPVWEFTVPSRSTPVNTSWGTTVDVNGDGFADVLVGAPAVGANVGAAYVYMGGPNGPSTTPSTLTGPDGTGGGFGSSVASAGDVNGDGFADVVVGASGVNNEAGAAYVYLGGAGGLAATPAVRLDPTGLSEHFGAAVASAGDVNGDGYADVIVGEDDFNNGRPGAAYLYLGGATGASTTPIVLNGPAGPNGAFGLSVASAGDVNGDGFADLVVGAAGVGINTGAAYVYLGGAGGPSTMPTAFPSPISGTDVAFGWSVASAGDVNGDGFADVLIGAYGYFGSGAAYVYLGGMSGLSTTPTSLPGHGEDFAASVAGAGDVDGDGFADVIVGSPMDDADNFQGTGAAFLYLGDTGGVSAKPVTLTAALPSPREQFGASVASAGDVNGDGFADVVVGAPLVNRVYVYFGSAQGLSTTPTILTGPDGGSLGASVASSAAVSGDPHS